MRKMIFMAVLLVCWATVWAGHPARPRLPEAGFDPTPRQFLAALSGTRGMDCLLHQCYEGGWIDTWRQEAIYDSLGRIGCINHYWASNSGDPLELAGRTLFEYSDDGQAQHVTEEYYYEGAWYPFWELLYEYENGMPQEINYNLNMYEGMIHRQTIFIYWPDTNILKRVVEFTYDYESPVPSVIIYDYAMDSASRPSEILVSRIDADWDQWYVQERRNYVYHNDDQTTHESYLRQLEFSYLGTLSCFFVGVQPSKLLEERVFHPGANGTWSERYRWFHSYNSDGFLNTIENFVRLYPWDPEIWNLSQYKDYTYQQGYPIAETTFSPNYGEEEFMPQYRYCMGYQEIVPAEDPAMPGVGVALSVYPNPFNPSAGISFRLETAGHIEISVYNLKGQKVRTLLEAKKSAGTHQTFWDGKDGAGRSLAAGIYLIRLSSGKESRTVKAVLAK